MNTINDGQRSSDRMKEFTDFLKWKNVRKSEFNTELQSRVTELQNRISKLNNELDSLRSDYNKIEATLNNKNIELEHSVIFDELTGLPNRKQFFILLDSHLRDEERSNQQRCLIIVDIDGFGNLNDTYGGEVLNGVLKILGTRLIDAFGRGKDFIARIGADEFAISLLLDNENSMCINLDRIQKLFHEKVCLENGVEISLQTSVGISVFPNDLNGKKSESLFCAASSALNQAKSGGGDKVVYFSTEAHNMAKEKQILSNALKYAIEKGELSLQYQPQINLKTGAMVGVEALLRWNHVDENGKTRFISPDVFIPIAEANGQIINIGKWVIDEAFRQHNKWIDSRFLLRMGINASLIQLLDGDNFVGYLKEAILRDSIDPKLINIEVTESIAEGKGISEQRIVSIFKQMCDLGVGLSIDDFGTGNSNLKRLLGILWEVVKFDKVFIDEFLDENSIGRIIIDTMIQMSNRLSIKTLAEGVETREQYVALQKAGCDEVQGYFVSRPLKPDSNEMQKLLLRNVVALHSRKPLVDVEN